MSDDIQRTLGEHSATLKIFGDAIGKMDGKLDRLLAAESERKGSKRATWSIAAAIASATSLAVTAAIELWRK